MSLRLELCPRANGAFWCHRDAPDSAGGSDRGERRSGKLCVLAHSEVISAALTDLFIWKHNSLIFKKPAFFSFRKPVYIHEISGRFDVGNLPSYVECDLYFREKLQNADSYMV